MLRVLAYKAAPILNRWGEAAPAACCGVCRTCTTTAATGLAATAAGLTLEAVGLRRGSGRDGHGSRAGDGASELGEDRQVGVQPDPLDAPDAQRREPSMPSVANRRALLHATGVQPMLSRQKSPM